MADLGGTIRAAREAKGMTQVALAAYFNISKSAVNQWESGKNIPDPRRIAALSELLEIDTALLVQLAGQVRPSGTGPTPSPAAAIEEIVRRVVREELAAFFGARQCGCLNRIF